MHLGVLGKAEEHAGVYASPCLVLLLQAQQLILCTAVMRAQETGVCNAPGSKRHTWKFQT